ncbi:hypothetical protein SAMN05216243_2538 [Sediminibacillus albus]|uniref:Uncharacterized protein n=1 Tax=Sediminibacillus albus TaxID=407036 RepID=A0A1G9AKL5_9BACI|nr:hypothetical protein SAMN05216243_2538 [Sediminibacillus albus]
MFNKFLCNLNRDLSTLYGVLVFEDYFSVFLVHAFCSLLHRLFNIQFSNFNAIGNNKIEFPKERIEENW